MFSCRCAGIVVHHDTVVEHCALIQQQQAHELYKRLHYMQLIQHKLCSWPAVAVVCTPCILLDEMHIIPADNDGLVHLGRLDCARQDTSTNGDVAGERALLVNVCACTKHRGKTLLYVADRFTMIKGFMCSLHRECCAGESGCCTPISCKLRCNIQGPLADM